MVDTFLLFFLKFQHKTNQHFKGEIMCKKNMCKIDMLKETLTTLPELPILIAGHKTPDQDSIGSCLTLCRILRALDKSAYVLCEKDDLSLVPFQNINDLVIANIQSLNFQNLLKNGYVFIALDLNDLSRLNYSNLFLKATHTINIDHHQGNSTGANFVVSCTIPSSTCEILYRLIEKIDKSLFTLETCQNLYCGIMTDTNCFSRRISPRTLEIAQDLINRGVDYYTLNQLVLWGRTTDELVATGILAQNIVDKKTFHYAICDKNMDYAKSLSQSVLVKKVAEDLRKIEGIDILVFLIDYGDKIVAKVMTNNCELADKIASQFAGGGGHKREAGFTTTLKITEIINIISKYLSN